jgi:hypothetical protein
MMSRRVVVSIVVSWQQLSPGSATGQSSRLGLARTEAFVQVVAARSVNREARRNARSALCNIDHLSAEHRRGSSRCGERRMAQRGRPERALARRFLVVGGGSVSLQRSAKERGNGRDRGLCCA